jgi:hypothetical protein
VQRKPHAKRRDDEERDPPSEQAIEGASDKRRKSRCRCPCDHGQCQCPCERPSFEQVTGDGARQDRGGTRPERLDDTAEDEQGQGAGKGAHDAARGKNCKSCENEPPPPKPIGEGPGQKLAESEGDEETAQCQPKLLGGHTKAISNPRECRQDDVGGQRSKRGKSSKQEQNLSRQAAFGRWA